jgi:hypothetical protein
MIGFLVGYKTENGMKCPFSRPLSQRERGLHFGHSKTYNLFPVTV